MVTVLLGVPEVLVSLQDCLAFGKPLLIENIEEELDPVLDPVLERRFVRKGKNLTVALADKEVGEPTFTLILSVSRWVRGVVLHERIWVVSW
jgi:ATP-binding dynein motor region